MDFIPTPSIRYEEPTVDIESKVSYEIMDVVNRYVKESNEYDKILLLGLLLRQVRAVP